jgi:host factor-I protein
MKPSPESTGVVRAPERKEDEFVSRKLIRPPLPQEAHSGGAAIRPEKIASARKALKAEQTHAETFYFQKQIQSKTPMTLVLKNGETVHGVIEWYDKDCLKVNRSGKSSLLIYKPAIRYMHKSAE